MTVRGQYRFYIFIVVSVITLSNLISTTGAWSADTKLNETGLASSAFQPSFTPVRLDLSITGTVLLGDGNDMATIHDEKTGSSDLYRLGETVGGATIISINIDSVEFEKDGQIITINLKHDGGLESGKQHSVAAGTLTAIEHSSGLSPVLSENEHAGLFEDGAIAENQPLLEPIFIASGPEADGDEPQMDLPYFEPTVDRTGPEPKPELKNGKASVSIELPPFEPVTNYTGPVVEDKKLSRELPPFEAITGPADNGSVSSPVDQIE